MNWFDVCKGGLAQIQDRKGREFAVYELTQNAWDQNATRVDISLSKEPGSRFATLEVTDDDPNGFTQIAHVWTLFEESEKKGAAEKRGRFNLGEKLVLALCEEAEIVSTTGAVRFDADGRKLLRVRRAAGSSFKGLMRMTNEAFALCCEAVDRLLPPPGIVTAFNGRVLPVRTPMAVFQASLRTEIADAEGNLRPTSRKTEVRVHELRPGEVGTLYELGIPVVETGDGYHVDVQQKVPLGFDRDSVPPTFLKHLRALVLNAVHEALPAEQATSVWVRDALGTSNVSPEAVRTVISQRFGEKAVVYDPSDREANKLAVVAGYTVVHSGQLSADEWTNVRNAGALRPAGKVTPSPKPFEPDGVPLKTIPPEDWSAEERATVELYKRLAPHLVHRPIKVVMAFTKNKWRACYGPAGTLYLNKRLLSRAFFAGGASEDALGLLIHEMGHEYSGDHLSTEYYRALTKVGARLALAVARDPGLLKHLV